MTSTDVSSDTSAQMSEAGTADMKLEVVTVPVSDVDRAKRFYQGLGWRLDADLTAGDAFRVVQFTPTHPVCSVSFGKGPGPACSTRRPSITTRTRRPMPRTTGGTGTPPTCEHGSTLEEASAAAAR